MFLKAVALARNRGVAFAGLTTVNLDFVRLYRPLTNVVTRPTAGTGRGYSLVGHHEIMIPLLAAAIIDADPSRPERRGQDCTCLKSRVPAGVAQLVRARVS